MSHDGTPLQTSSYLEGGVPHELSLDHEGLDVVDGVDVVHGVDHHLAHLLQALVGAHRGHGVALHQHVAPVEKLHEIRLEISRKFGNLDPLEMPKCC